jgi:hypothetical protein
MVVSLRRQISCLACDGRPTYIASEVKGGISLKPGRTPGPYFVRLLVDEATGGISLRVMARDAMGEGSRTSLA